MVIEIPLVPAGAIYAKARNADGTAAGGLFFGVSELKRAPGRDNSSPLDSGGDGISDNLPRKWVSGPLPLGGTYQIYCWRGNLFSVSKPVKLTESNPDAEVELQFPSGKIFDGVILNADGKPLRDAELKVSFELAEGHGFGLKSVFTDGLGRFHLEDMTPDLGRYSVEANVPGVMAEIVKLDFGSQPQTIRLQRGQTLTGRVVEAGTGYAIPNAEVRARVLDGKLPMLTTQTDADGRFEFTTLGNGDYTLYVADGQLLSNKTFRADGDTNVVLPVKLYAWSKVKPKAPPIKTDSEPAGPEMMTFKIDRPPDADSLKKLLLDAGVKTPPTVYFYTDNGLLLVRGTPEQLALVKSAVLKLNGYLPKEIPAETNVSTGFRERLEAIVERSHKDTVTNYGKTETASDPSENASPPVSSGITNKTTSNANASTNLETRTFMVDANIFLAALQKQTGLPTNVTAATRQFLSNAGVDLSPPKSIYFNETRGLLLVRTTRQDLDAVEKAIPGLNMTPPQIHIKARFIEVPQETLKLLGTNSIPTGTTNATGILTDANFRLLLQTLEQCKGVENLAEPEVTTIIGRQTQMRATESIAVIDGINPQTLTPPGVLSTDNTKGMKTVQIETGPAINVFPHLLADGHTIYLEVTASVTEFTGYDEREKTNLATIYVDGRKKQVNVPMPQFTTRELKTNVEFQDNQTVVLGGGISTQITATKETVPVSGDAATGEPRFREQTTRIVGEKKQLLVLITATLVDAAGNRIHRDDEMPIAHPGIPSQDSR
jgi:type II secretory pathway component GspD/PulD (secretin)